MVIEVSAQHLAILGPLIKGIGSRVRANESLAVVANEAQQVVFLLPISSEILPTTACDSYYPRVLRRR